MDAIPVLLKDGYKIQKINEAINKMFHMRTKAFTLATQLWKDRPNSLELIAPASRDVYHELKILCDISKKGKQPFDLDVKLRMFTLSKDHTVKEIVEILKEDGLVCSQVAIRSILADISS